MNRYYIIYKPFQVLSQFSESGDKKILKDYFKVAADVYPVGRLDFDSEGLLLMTNDKKLNHRLLNPLFAHERTYWVQVDGNISQQAIEQLQSGVNINVDGRNYHTKECQVTLFNMEPIVPERNPPIRFRKNIPAPWIALTLTEGKNRQVRKMTAAVGYPTLRLIRYSIGSLNIDGLMPGDIREMEGKEVYHKLFGQ
jgi:23S rRNA pseudouridine2457 synthase